MVRRTVSTPRGEDADDNPGNYDPVRPETVGKPTSLHDTGVEDSTNFEEKSFPEYVEGELARHGACDRFQFRHTIFFGAPWMLYGMQILAHVLVTLDAERAFCGTPSGECVPLAEGNCSVDEHQVRYANTRETLVAEFQLVCEEDFKVPLLSSGFFLGFLLGVSGFGVVSDTRGRKAAYMLSTLMIQIGAFMAAVAPGYLIYGLARVLIGGGVGGAGLTTFVWNSEVLGPQSRAILASTTNGAFAFGVLLLPALALSMPGWRELSAALFVLGLPCAGLGCLHESPKWLATKGRAEEAHVVLLRIAAVNGKTPPVAPPNLKVRNSAAVEGGDGKGAEPPAEAPLRDLFFDRRLSLRMGVMCLTWFSLSAGYYGLSLSVSNLGFSPYTAMVIGQLTELPVYFIAAPLVETACAGRRGTSMSNLLICGACCVGAAMIVPSPVDGEDQPEVPKAMALLVYIGKASVALAFAVVYLYAAELFPTNVRSRALGIQSLCSRVGGMIAPVIASLGRHSMALALIIFALPSIVSGILLLGLPETRGQRVPDTIADVAPPTTSLLSIFKRYKRFDDSTESS